jgi:hypothetical protein
MSNTPCIPPDDSRRAAIAALVAADGHNVILALNAEFGAELRRQMPSVVADAVERVESECGVPLLITCADELLSARDIKFGAEAFGMMGHRDLTDIKLACARAVYGRCMHEAKLIWDTAPFDRSREVLTYLSIVIHVDGVLADEFKKAVERWMKTGPGRAYLDAPKPGGARAFARRWMHAIDHYYDIYSERLARCGMRFDAERAHDRVAATEPSRPRFRP